MVPFILSRDRENTCPMEKLSISKDFSPDEFYKTVMHQYDSIEEQEG